MDKQKLRGVNLGGWLLLEKWMTPTLFKGTESIDEYTFMQTDKAVAKLISHRDSFITENDFRWIRDSGLNAIRIPVGYWVLTDQPPFIAATKYLDWAMDMAQQYSLQVIIDVHGLEGSQNGRDHSGRVGKSLWFQKSEFRENSLRALVGIATRYKDYDNFWGLQIINEPKSGLLHFTLRKYYHRAFKRLSGILRPHTYILYSDAFTPRLFSDLFRLDKHHVAMDVHIYHMTTLFSRYLSVDWFLKKTLRRKKILERLSKRQPIIIGEWSGLLRGETMSKIPQEEHMKFIKNYIQLQMDVYGVCAGWFYWNYKTEQTGSWNFRSLVEDGTVTLR